MATSGQPSLRTKRTVAALVTLALVSGLALLFHWATREGLADPASPPPRAATEPAPTHAASSSGEPRSEVKETGTIAAPTSAKLPAEPASGLPETAAGVVRGRLVFLDGSAVPLQQLEFVPLEQEANPEANRRTCTTDWEGHFVFTAPTASCRVRLAASARIRESETIVPCPSEDVVLHVEGFGLALNVLDRGGEPLRGALLHITGAGSSFMLHSNRDGRAAIATAQALQVDVVARKDDLVAELAAVDLPGEADLVVRDLVLLPPQEFGRLAVVVRTRAGSRLNDFSVRLVDARVGEQAKFLRSDRADADGTFGDIPVGTYSAKLAPSYWATPELFAPRTVEPREVTVLARATTTVEFEVEPIGRLRVRIDRPDAPAARKAVVKLRDAEGKVLRLDCRAPGADDTVTVADSFPLNAALFVDQPLPDGTYTLTAEARDLGHAAATVHVIPGRITDVTLRLE